MPMHAFIIWLALLNRLSTRCRQVKFNPSLSATCLFCNLDETRDHLYFACSYTSRVWNEVVSRVGKIRVIPYDWPSLLDGTMHTLLRGANINILTKNALQDCIYFIWVEGNAKIYDQGMRPVDELTHQILQFIRWCVLSLPKVWATYPLL